VLRSNRQGKTGASITTTNGNRSIIGETALAFKNERTGSSFGLGSAERWIEVLDLAKKLKERKKERERRKAQVRVKSILEKKTQKKRFLRGKKGFPGK